MLDKKPNKNSNWYLVTVDDTPKLLPGKSIIDVLQLLSSIVKFNFVITDEVEGLGREICNLQDKRNSIIEFDEIFQLICDINQFEWGDFFLFKEYPKNWSNSKGELYPSIIAKSDTTVRAIDNQYIYIYTPYQELVEALKNTYIVEGVKVGSLDILDYPY